MDREIKKDNKLIQVRFFIILCIFVLWNSTGITAYAEEPPFSVDAKLLPSDKDAYYIQVMVENQEADWEGIVRLRLGGTYNDLNDCVFDTVLALPQGSKKQFVVKIPEASIGSTNGTVLVSFLNNNQDVIGTKEFKQLLFQGTNALLMGILSDEYSSLTYLDMGGETYSYHRMQLPIKLTDLNQDNLADSLDSLTFLVIDSYNTSVLTDEELKQIELWIDKGGILILGTGNHAQDILSGFDFLGIECSKVYAPGESNPYDDYTIDTSQIHYADLRDIHSTYSVRYDPLMMMSSQGDGAVGVMAYSFSELGSLGMIENSGLSISSLLEEVGQYASSHYAATSLYSDMRYELHRILRTWGNGENHLSFGALKTIIILYVIFVGPILYLILRFLNKRDLYWITVPITTLAGILLVYLSGRGFEVVNTNVYSVTIEDLSHREKPITFLRCYDSSHKEWDLQLAENFEYAGPISNIYYGGSKNDRYHTRIQKEGERLSFGVWPTTSFEDGYFVARSSSTTETGSISSDIETFGASGIRGTVTNQTGRDFAYFAVIADNKLCVYENLPTGESLDLAQNAPVYEDTSNYDTILNSYLYDFLRNLYFQKKPGSTDLAAALGMGIYTSYYSLENIDETIVIGVTKDWEPVVDDNCSEISYGCVYMIQK